MSHQLTHSKIPIITKFNILESICFRLVFILVIGEKFYVPEFFIFFLRKYLNDTITVIIKLLIVISY